MKVNFKMVAAAMAVLGAASCSKTDLYDPAQAENYKKVQEEIKIDEKKADYENNFVAKFGAVDPYQSWDFSTGTPHLSLPSSARQAGTRAGGYERSNSADYYEFPDVTINKMKDVFVESRKENKDMGSAFGMYVPDNAFTIMPMYMGMSAGDFELWMHVDGIDEDILVWSKWQGIQVKGPDVDDWTDVKTYDAGSNCSNATAIRSKYYTFSGLPKGAVMYFYLKITETATEYNQKGEELSSINDYMRTYTFSGDELPDNLPGATNPQVMIIGCEDATTSMSDTDYNDVVFMLYGEPFVPTTFEVEQIEKTYSKRYMIEDLGATDDFDFNDIVVDVYETYTQDKTTAQGKTVWSEAKLKDQKAILRHRGGILPFELTIGNTTLDKIPGVLGDDPNTEFTVTGWDRAANNISVKVYQSENTETAVNVNFPQTGSVPMIIATDTYVDWAAERVTFNWQAFMGN